MNGPNNINEDHMSRKRTPTDQEPTANTSTTTAEPPAANQDTDTPASDGQSSFAERVGERKGIAIPDPFSIAGDYLAGVRLFESRQDRQMAIKLAKAAPRTNPAKRSLTS